MCVLLDQEDEFTRFYHIEAVLQPEETAGHLLDVALLHDEPQLPFAVGEGFESVDLSRMERLLMAPVHPPIRTASCLATKLRESLLVHARAADGRYPHDDLHPLRLHADLKPGACAVVIHKVGIKTLDLAPVGGGPHERVA